MRRRARLIAATTLAVVLLAALATYLMPRYYESEALLRIGSDEPRSDLLGELAPLGALGLGGLAEDEIDTEIGVLESRAIAEVVVDSLSLHIRVLEPGRPRDSVLHILDAPRDATEGEYVLQRRSDGAYELRERSGGPAGTPRAIRPGEPFRMGEVSASLVPAEGGKSADRIRVSVEPFWEVVEELRDDLQIRRQNGRSRLIEIRYRGTDPVLTAGIVNGVVQTFMAFNTRSSKLESRSRVRVLRDQIASYEGELRAAEERLRAFREAQQVVSLEDQASEQIRRLAELQAKGDALDVERRSLASLLANIEAEPNATASDYRRLATFPSFLANRGVQDILASLIELENERAKLLVQRTPQNADVQGIDRRIDELENQLHTLGRSYLASLESQIDAASTVLAQSGAQLQAVPERELQYARIAREQKLLAEIYTLLQTQLKQAEIEEAIELGDVRVIDTGLVPAEPVFPRPFVNLALAAVLGLMMGVAVAVGREVLDPRVRSRGDAVEAAEGLPVLSVIPRIPLSPNGKHRAVPLVGSRRRSGLRPSADGATLPGPRDPEAEAYRALHTSLVLANRERELHTLVLTSAEPGSGTTRSAANLAITFAQRGYRALLIDADLRSGQLHRRFGMEPRPGLSEILLGDATPEAAIQKVPTGDYSSPLDFLPVGSVLPDPAGILTEVRIRPVFAHLRERYDAIILDTPPLDRATDAAVLGAVADAVILVARTGWTEREALQSVVSYLSQLRVEVAGLVLNDGEPGEASGENAGPPGPRALPRPQRTGERDPHG